MISLWLFQTFHSAYAVAAFLAFMSLISAWAAFHLGRQKPAEQNSVSDSLKVAH